MEAGIGERFARALAARDAASLKEVLAPDVDFRALTPDKFWDSHDAVEVVDSIFLSEWFEPDDRILGVLNVDIGEIDARHHVSYRFAVERPDGPYQIEQQAYFDVDAGRISWLRILCSGFQKIEMP